MSLIHWGSNLALGVTVIDEQHHQLVDILNELHGAMEGGKGREVMAHVLGELIAYTQMHFATEEKLMAQHGYAQSAAHKAEHAKLVADVGDFAGKFKAGKATVTVELLKFLREWLSHHILGSDKALATALAAKGVH